MKPTMMLYWTLAMLAVAGCGQQSDHTGAPQDPTVAGSFQAPPPPAPSALAPSQPLELPENVTVQGDWLFAMETTPELIELVLHGTDQERLAGRLTDGEGRREIVYYGSGYRTPEVIFPAGWLLPAVGAVNAGGEMLVCVNRLVGKPSALTKGNMPDPTQGVDLACRWRSSRGWSSEYVLPRPGASLWLTDVVALAQGSFRIIYARDETGLVVDDVSDLEGIYRQSFDRGRLGKPELARRFKRLSD